MCQNICVRDRPTEAVENIYKIIGIYVLEIVLRGYIKHTREAICKDSKDTLIVN